MASASKPSSSSADDDDGSQVVVGSSEQHYSVQDEQIVEMLASNNKISEIGPNVVPLERLSSKQTRNNIVPQLHFLANKIVENGTSHNGQQNTTDTINRATIKPQESIIKPSKKRYFVLFMYIVLQLVKSFQWICLASITNVAAKFYMVDNYAINWTAILFMVTFLILALPCSWFMELFGLRRSVLIGSFGVTLGLIIKCFSCHRNGFLLGMFGHLIVGLTEPFYFSSYSQMASVWFPDNQVARATSFAIIGEEFGLALGFIIPPFMVGLGNAANLEHNTRNDNNIYHEMNVATDNYDDQADGISMEVVQDGLWMMFFTLAIISILNTVSIWLFFDEQPPRAPGIARFKQIEAIKLSDSGCLDAGRSVAIKNFKIQWKQLHQLIRDKNFIKLFVGFGLNVGVSYSIHTLLNQMIMRSWWPADGHEDELAHHDYLANHLKHSLMNSSATNNDILGRLSDSQLYTHGDINLIVGNTGLILIASGLFGSASVGFILDRYHRHKLTTSLIYLLTLISMVVLFAWLNFASKQQHNRDHSAPAWPLYLLAIPLGFALTGYASCGYDYGVEITYPKAELLSSTLLNVSAQIFGIPISLIGSKIVDSYGDLALGFFFSSILLLGFLLTCLQGGQLYRQKAVQVGKVHQIRAEDGERTSEFGSK